MITLPNANHHLSNGIPEYKATDRLYITIIGGHGAGKTFMACALWDVLTGGIPLELHHAVLGENVHVHSYNDVLLVGKYGLMRKCGGMDSIKTKNRGLYTALELALSNPEQVVMAEGMTVNSQSMMTWLANNSERWDRRIVYIHLLPNHDVQVQRILRRSGRTSIKEKYVKMKSDQFLRNDAYLLRTHAHSCIIRVPCEWDPFAVVTRVIQNLLESKIIERVRHDKAKEKSTRTIRVRRDAVRRAQHRSHK